jgi:16S rRNA (uracil1498-N3)-methyltransferase
LSRHLLRTLSLRTGDEARLVCGDGFVYRVRLQASSASDVHLEIVEREPARADPTVAVTLYVGALKGDQLTYVIEQLTELGVSRIVPMETERSLRRLPFRSHPKWQRTAWGSAIVSGRSRAPDVHTGMRFVEAVAESRGGILLQERRPELPSLRAVLPQNQAEVAVFVGPEDGFSEAEIQQALTAGLVCCTLGPRMLRGLTAAIAAVTLVLHERGQLQ